jgi:hypothetical protein
MELPRGIMKLKLVVGYNFTRKIKISVNTLQKQAPNGDIQRKYSAVTFYAMETLTRCPISQVWFSHMNKCKGGGALKYTFKYNIHKQTNKLI